MQAAILHKTKQNPAKARNIEKDIKILADFTEVYCREHHGDFYRGQFKNNRYFPESGPTVCDDCAKILGYAIGKRMACPMDPKPTCRKCPDHCYKNGYNEKMTEIMKFSGPWLIRHGRLGLLLHYLK